MKYAAQDLATGLDVRMHAHYGLMPLAQQPPLFVGRSTCGPQPSNDKNGHPYSGVWLPLLVAGCGIGTLLGNYVPTYERRVNKETLSG